MFFIVVWEWVFFDVWLLFFYLWGLFFVGEVCILNINVNEFVFEGCIFIGVIIKNVEMVFDK